MPKITYITADGEEQLVDAPVGATAMEAAVNENVRGIDGDCGGLAACGTCHVYVDPEWIDKTGRPPEEQEIHMLELSDDTTKYSRLSCQIALTDDLDGAVLRMPESQH